MASAQQYDAGSIAEDSNFKSLASPYLCKLEEFKGLLEKHVCGYTQGKRLLDGLKELTTRMEAIENKLSIAKAVGKAKGKLEEEEQKLSEAYKLSDLKEKVKILNDCLSASIEAHRITAEEQPWVLEQIQARLAKAKADNKEKLQEKLERQCKSLSKNLSAAAPFTVPVPGVIQIMLTKEKLSKIEKLEKKVKKSLSVSEQELISEKGALKSSLDSLITSNRMWFETEVEFKERLDKAMITAAELAADQARDELLREAELRRLEAEEKEKQKGDAIIKKIEQKRVEAQALPQKPVPEPKKKEKKKMAKMNPNELFQNAHLPSGAQAEEEQGDAGEDTLEEEAENNNSAAADDRLAEGAMEISSAVSQITDSQQPEQPEQEAKVKLEKGYPQGAKKVQESKWSAVPVGNSTAATEQQDEEAEEKADDDVADEIAGPSLMEAMSKCGSAAEKKVSAPQPKKKEKKKFQKVALNSLGFEYSDAGAGA